MIREILLLPRDLQARLVAALDSRVRLLATTTSEPETALKAERIRPDLYFALTTLVVRLEPLRERRAELPALAQHLLERANAREGKQRAGFSAAALSALTSYHWPGNIRELARVIDHAHARDQGPWINLEDLPASIRGNLGSAYPAPCTPHPIKPLDELLTDVERRAIETALRQGAAINHARPTCWESRACASIGVSRSSACSMKMIHSTRRTPPADRTGTPSYSHARFSSCAVRAARGSPSISRSDRVSSSTVCASAARSDSISERPSRWPASAAPQGN